MSRWRCVECGTGTKPDRENLCVSWKTDRGSLEMEGYMDGIESVRYFLPEGHGKEKNFKNL